MTRKSPFGCCLLLVLCFVLQVPAWGQCTAPTGLNITNVTGTSAQLNFTPSAAATSYSVSYTSPSTGQVFTVSPNPTASPVQLIQLSATTSYTVTVVSNCANGQTAGAAVTFITTALNDEPCTAIALPRNPTCQPSSGTTATATPTTPNGYTGPGCANIPNARDVWYTFTTAATGAASTGATLTVAGSNARELRLFSGAACSSALTEVACSVDPAGVNAAPPLVVGSLTPSTTYYVRVASPPTSAGSFTICVTDPPACDDPLNVAIGTITATTAQLALTPGPGNLSYTVTLTPQNGTTTTLTPNPTTSPIALTNLLPLTAYTLTVRANCASSGLGSVITRTFTSGNPQDEPMGAVALPIGPSCQPTTSTNAQATATPPNGYTNPGCAVASAPKDVWFTVTTAATGLASSGVNLTAGALPPASNPTGVLPASQVRLFSSAGGAAGPFTPIGCIASARGNMIAPPLIVAGLMPNTTYYVAVSGFSDSDQQGGFTLCATAAPACPSAAALTATPQTTTTAQLDWTVTGGGGTFTVEYGPAGFVPGTGAAGAVRVPGLTATSYPATGLTPGQPYEFYVTRDCGGAGSSTRSGPRAFQTQVLTNDDPCGAVLLAISSGTCTTPTSGTLAGATSTPLNTTLPGGPCANQSPATDVWYRFTTASTGSASTEVVVAVTGATVRYLMAMTGSNCAGPYTCTGVVEGSANQPTPPLVLRGLSPNTTYYVRVGGLGAFGSNQPGPFTICVSSPAPACNLPTAIQLSALTATAATLSFTAPAGNTGYTLVLSGGAGSGTQTVTASPVNLSGLAPSTAYTLTLQSNCAGGQSAPYTLTFTTPAVGPANAVCSGAVTVTCGQTVLGTTVNAQTVFQTPNVCRPGGNSPGVFYRFIGTGDTIKVALCHPATNFPVAIALLSGNCGALTCLGGNDLDFSCPLNVQYAAYTFFSQPGVNYYIFIQGPGAGNFGLTLTCVAPACQAPTMPLATGGTATTATINFTPATGSTANGFSVVATPTSGGLPVTATGPGSPITLSGLAPGTAYRVTIQALCGSAGSSPNATTSFTTSGTACPTPSGVGVNSITATTASVGFTGTAATSYIATATPTTGGPAVIQTGAASPLTLSGLAPNTAYNVTVLANCASGAASPSTAPVPIRTLLGTQNATLASLVGFYPNPAHESVMLTLPAVLTRQPVSITLFNLLGQSVRHYTVPESTHATQSVLGLSNLPAGVYQMQLTTGLGSFSKRLSIEQ
ncbi:MAG: fibronectin type III domain-containing protein [Bacteroidota bacterium]|nr:fibronectin type III domain-containing protein [Bacteroidota bacterium]